MKVKSVRLPEDIDRAIEYVGRNEKLEKTQALRKLARMGFECYVSKSYERGRISLREAADLLTLTLSETIDLLGEMGVKGNLRAEDVLESFKGLGMGGGRQ
jgi:predicted HTH domain antitoxin